MKFLSYDGLIYFWSQVKNYIDTKYNELFQSVSNGKTAVANAITGKGVSTSATATFATMASNISKIQTGTNTNDATATAAHILSGQTAYVKGSKINGNMPNVGSGTNTVSTLNDSTTNRSAQITNMYVTPGDNAIHTEFIPPKGYYDGVNSKIHLRLWGVSPEHVASEQPIGSLINPWLKGTYNGISNVRGSVKSYYAYAGQSIQAGDFVKYVTGIAGVGSGNFTPTVISTPEGHGSNLLATLGLNETQTVIVCNSNYQLAPQVYVGTLNGITMTYSNAIAMYWSNANYERIDVCKISDASFAIVEGSNGDVRIHVYSISGNILQLIRSNAITLSMVVDAYPRRLYSLGNNKFALCFVTGYSTGRPYVVLVDYSTSTPTVVDYKSGSYDVNFTACDFSLTPDGSTIVMMGADNSTGRIVDFKITQSTVTIGTQSVFATALSVPRLLAISATEMFAVTLGDGNIPTLRHIKNRALLRSVSLGSTAFYQRAELVLLSPGKLICTWGSSGANPPIFYSVVCNYSDSALTLGTISQFSYNAVANHSTSPRGMSIMYGTKLIIGISLSSTTQGLYIIINVLNNTIDTINYIYETQIAKATTNDEIQGVAHSNATGGTLSGANAGHNQATNVTSITSP
jgi:hypothetical protein